MKPCRKCCEVGSELFCCRILTFQELLLGHWFPHMEVDEVESFNLTAQGLVVEQYLLVHRVGEKQFFLQSVADLLLAFAAHHLDPLHQCLPLAKQCEELVVAYLIEASHFLKPVRHSYKLHRFCIQKFANTLATECIVVPDVLLVDLAVRDHVHIVVVVGLSAHQVDELLRYELLLSHHSEEQAKVSVLVKALDVLLGLFNCRGNQLLAVAVLSQGLLAYSFHFLLIFLVPKAATSDGLPTGEL